jgi:hypothetical protein
MDLGQFLKRQEDHLIEKDRRANPPAEIPPKFSSENSIRIQKGERRHSSVRRRPGKSSFRPDLTATKGYKASRPIRLDDVEADMFRRNAALAALRLEAESHELDGYTFYPEFYGQDRRDELAERARARQAEPKLKAPSHDSAEEEERRKLLATEKLQREERKRIRRSTSEFTVPFERQKYESHDHRGRTIAPTRV